MQLTKPQADALVELKHIEQHVMFTSSAPGGRGGDTTVHNRCGFLCGPSGSGKTTVLAHLIHGEFSKWSLDKTTVTKDGSVMVVKTVPVDRLRFFTLVVTPCTAKWTHAFEPDERVLCATSAHLEKALSDRDSDVRCKLVLIKPSTLWRAAKNPRSNLHTTRIMRVVYDRANDVTCTPVLDANFIWYLDSREDDHVPRLAGNLFDKQTYSVDEMLSWNLKDWKCVSCDRSCTARSVRSINTVALRPPSISFSETSHTAYVYTAAESHRDTLLRMIRNGDIGTACNLCGIPDCKHDTGDEEIARAQCPIGYHEIDVAISLPCDHTFELENLITWALATSDEVTEASCPMCRQVSRPVEWSVSARGGTRAIPNLVDCIAQIHFGSAVGTAMVVVTHDARMQNTIAMGLHRHRIPCNMDHSLRAERHRAVGESPPGTDPPVHVFQVHRGENVGSFLFSSFDVVVLVGDIPDALGKKIIRRCARHNTFAGKASLQAHRIRIAS